MEWKLTFLVTFEPYDNLTQIYSDKELKIDHRNGIRIYVAPCMCYHWWGINYLLPTVFISTSSEMTTDPMPIPHTFQYPSQGASADDSNGLLINTTFALGIDIWRNGELISSTSHWF